MVVLAACTTLTVQARERTISDLAPIPLQMGINHIPGFAPDGREGIIALGWRDNGNAHGFDIALMLLPDERGRWNVVRIEPATDDRSANGADIATDDPHTFEDVVKAFRLAHGKVDGKAATLLLVATRDQGNAPIPDPSQVTFYAYDLEHDPQVGTTPDHFSLILRDRSSGTFCNAEKALSERFRLPLPASYEGTQAPDGC